MVSLGSVKSTTTRRCPGSPTTTLVPRNNEDMSAVLVRLPRGANMHPRIPILPATLLIQECLIIPTPIRIHRGTLPGRIHTIIPRILNVIISTLGMTTVLRQSVQIQTPCCQHIPQHVRRLCTLLWHTQDMHFRSILCLACMFIGRPRVTSRLRPPRVRSWAACASSTFILLFLRALLRHSNCRHRVWMMGSYPARARRLESWAAASEIALATSSLSRIIPRAPDSTNNIQASAGQDICLRRSSRAVPAAAGAVPGVMQTRCSPIAWEAGLRSWVAARLAHRVRAHRPHHCGRSNRSPSSLLHVIGSTRTTTTLPIPFARPLG